MATKRTCWLIAAVAGSILAIVGLVVVVGTANWGLVRAGTINLATQDWRTRDEESARMLATSIARDEVRAEIAARATELDRECEYSAEDVSIRVIHSDNHVYVAASFVPWARKRFSLLRCEVELDHQAGIAGKRNRIMQQAIEDVVSRHAQEFAAVHHKPVSGIRDFRDGFEADTRMAEDMDAEQPVTPNR